MPWNSSSEWFASARARLGRDYGLRDTSPVTADDAPPEQSDGGEEPQPDGLKTKAAYSGLDPRSGERLSPGVRAHGVRLYVCQPSGFETCNRFGGGAPTRPVAAE